MTDPRAASFGAVAEEYEPGRPGRPARVAEVAGLWFDAPRAVGEIARVLRPGGSLVVCFNEPSGETEPPWPEEARDVVRRWRPPGEVGGRHLVEAGVWREAFEDAPFEALRSELRELLPERTWRTPLRTEIWSTRRRAG